MGREKFNETHFMLSRVLLVLSHETKGHFQIFIICNTILRHFVNNIVKWVNNVCIENSYL